MRKLTRAGIKHPSKLKDYIINKTLNPRLNNAGDSGFHQTTQQGFFELINGNEDFCYGGSSSVCSRSLLINHKFQDYVPMRSRCYSHGGTVTSLPKSCPCLTQQGYAFLLWPVFSIASRRCCLITTATVLSTTPVASYVHVFHPSSRPRAVQPTVMSLANVIDLAVVPAAG